MTELDFHSRHLLDFISELSLKAHQLCLDLWINPSSIESQLSSAFFCGAELAPKSKLHDLWTRSQLYHLLVISGAHLAFLRLLIDQFFPKSFWFIKPFTSVLFTFVCKFQPPIARALVADLLRTVRYPKFWKQLLVTLICLLMIPSWFLSKSFQLSTQGTLVFLKLKNEPKIASLFLTWLFMVPLLIPIQSQSLIVFFWAFALAPLVLTLVLLIALVHSLSRWFKTQEIIQFLTDSLILVLKSIGDQNPQAQGLPLIEKDLAWLWILMTFVVFVIHEIQKEKEALR